MCTKTKTSFGCGHCVKTTEDCGIPHCQTLEKWKIPKDMDCAKCRASGDTVTRGKDGRGRHGRERLRHEESRQSSSDTYIRGTQSPGTAYMAISPWVPRTPEIPQEKPWTTPTRQKADEAWLIEHERRMSDLEEKTNRMSLGSNQKKSRKASPRASYERVIEVTELTEEPEDMNVSSQTKLTRLLPYEIEEASKSTSRHRSRKISHDSEGSMPHYQEGPLLTTPRRKARFVPPISEHNPHEYHDMPRRSRPHGSKTEPYYSQSCHFESPLSGSPLRHGDWTYQYHSGQPMRRDPYYPTTYPVY